MALRRVERWERIALIAQDGNTLIRHSDTFPILTPLCVTSPSMRASRYTGKAIRCTINLNSRYLRLQHLQSLGDIQD